LADEAHQAGLTLSLYVKNLVASHRATINEITEQSKEILHEVLEKNRSLIKKINFYENDTLRNLFLKNRNQIIEFKNTKGETVALKVLEIGDVYTIIINTFRHK
jgi:DNA repair protein RadC